MFKSFLVVGLGSFLGGGLRFWISRLVGVYFPGSFPIGTLFVNSIGCLLIGIFYALFERESWMNPALKLFLTVGFCGGFTTFSTFINENIQLMKASQLVASLCYTGLSLIGGVIAFIVGYSSVHCKL